MTEPVGEPRRAAQSFVDALTGRDFDALEGLFSPDVRFRALVPSGVREATDAAGAVAWLRDWFGVSKSFDVVDAGVEEVGGRGRLWYRFCLDRHDRRCLIDQEGFCDVRRGLVTDLSLVCSGFRPVEDAGIEPDSGAVCPVWPSTTRHAHT
jgi:hypothetical protein